ncbi:MAG: MmgE/PrpD family protein, partial [Alphaproteobacteria bacterium]
MVTSLTQELGAFVAGLDNEALPPEAAEVVRMGVIDTVGVMTVGQIEPGPGILLATLRAAKEAPESRLFLGTERISAPLAALVNGTAAHVLDFDDVAMPLGGHPSTVLVPAILAEADALPEVSGADMVAAYVAGYEVWAELVPRDKDAHHSKGWHPTSIFGVLAAAAACARLRRLNARKAANALAIAASEACGVIANFGSMTKSFHAGRAAQAGLEAARLAANGMDGSMDAIEHPGGFLAAVSPGGRTDLESPATALGKNWRIVAHRLDIKKYPMCYCVHRSLDAALDLLTESPVKAEQVTRIEARIGKLASEILRNHLPQTGLEAKFSIEFAVASAVIAGRAGLAQLSDSFVGRADVQDMMSRVEVV